MNFSRKIKKRINPKEISDKTRREIVEEVCNNLGADKMAEMWATVLYHVLAFEHIDRKHTGKWLTKWLEDFEDFCEAVRKSGEPPKALNKILIDECKFDLIAEYEKIMSKTKQKAKEKAFAIGRN